jgi:NAD(P)-dependent dehydrogenase (short-subunit alcohol dehydrogenase family)
MAEQPDPFDRAVVITGVSTGIGWGAAKVLIAHGHHVFGSVRKQADADRLKKEFAADFTPLLFDVTDPEAVAKAERTVRKALDGRRLSGLVNNAGIAVPGPILEMPLDDFRKALEVNIVGVVAMSQAFGPLLGSDEGLRGSPGRIVNIGSIGGRHAFPFNAPYHVTKYGLEGLTESMRRELTMFGIDCILVAPGTVKTAIWDKAQDLDFSRYEGTRYEAPMRYMQRASGHLGENGVPSEAMGEVIRRALTDPRPKTRYVSTNDPLVNFALNHFPKRLMDRIVARRVGIGPGAGSE